MRHLETYYYVATQDGRWSENEYTSEIEAAAEINRATESERKGLCVNHYEKEVSGYDSTADTLAHIAMVQKFLTYFASNLMHRGIRHDASKLGANEKPHFDRETPLLKDLTYNSPAYKESLARLGDALKHHYAVNSHHPEHYADGVSGMNLFDIVEMFCDWRAASQRNKGGKLNLESAFERFNFDPQLAQIFRNTADHLGVEVVEK